MTSAGLTAYWASASPMSLNNSVTASDGRDRSWFTNTAPPYSFDGSFYHSQSDNFTTPAGNVVNVILKTSISRINWPISTVA